MLNIFKRWNNFINEGVAQKYKFDTAVDVITDEALTALKKGIDNSLNGGDRIEFRFVDGESSNRRSCAFYGFNRHTSRIQCCWIISGK